MEKETQTKQCSLCKEELPIEKFGIRKNANGTDTVYRLSMCPDCYVVKAREWQKNNPDKYNEYQRLYQNKRYNEKKNDPEFKAKRNAYAREYYKKIRQKQNAGTD